MSKMSGAVWPRCRKSVGSAVRCWLWSASTNTPKYNYVHYFEIREVDELDRELLGLLREARAIGDLQNLIQRQTR